MAASGLTRWAVRLVGCLAVAAISSGGTWVWMTTIRTIRPLPNVPLTVGLSGKWEDISKEFDRRVKISFPIGSSEEQMGTELKRQGFCRQDWRSSTEQERDAIRREDNGVCRQAAYVHWRVDAQGHLTAVRGEYREEGCL
jgi:hypothetical protein